MAEPKVISVNLYGGKSLFGGRESALVKDTITCTEYDRCSLYKEGKCLRCRALASFTACPNGQTETTRGYTSRAKKYSLFKRKAEEHPAYGKLRYPDCYVAVLGDWVYLHLSYFKVWRPVSPDGCRRNVALGNGYVLTENVLGNNPVKKNDLTADMLYIILSQEPTTWNGQPITRYKEEVVPRVLFEVKKLLPELYKELVSLHPEMNMAPYNIGRYALVRTMVNGSIITDSHGNKATLKDGKLYCDDFAQGFIPFNGVKASLVVEVGENQTAKVTDESQCDENTRFV